MATKAFPKVLIAFLILLILLGGFFWYALNQPRFIAGTTKFFLNKGISNIVYKEITIEKLEWASFDVLTLHNVRIRCKINKDSYFFSAGTMSVDHLKGLLGSSPLSVKVQSLAIVSDMVNASDVNLEAQAYFHAFQLRNTIGSAHISKLELDQYVLKPFNAEFKGTLSRLELSNIRSQFYKGNIEGSLIMDLKPEIKYEFQVQLERINLEDLASANPSAFQNMKGQVSGSLAAKTTTDTLKELKIDLNMPKGGSIPSNILSALTKGVLPEGLLRQPLERALAEEESIPFVNLSVFIEMTGAEKYKAKINILSPKASIDLRNTYDINMDGGPYEILSVLKLVHPN